MAGSSRRARPRPSPRARTTPQTPLVSTETVTKVLEPVVRGAGAYLEAVTVRRAGARSLVRVTIDLPADEVGALSLDALAEVSRAVSTALDEANSVPDTYTLEVSTPGTDRPLTELRHFRRARTRLVTLALHDGSGVTGRLIDVTGDDATAELELDIVGSIRTIALSDVARGQVEVELNRAAEIADDDLLPIDDEASTEAVDGPLTPPEDVTDHGQEA